MASLGSQKVSLREHWPGLAHGWPSRVILRRYLPKSNPRHQRPPMIAWKENVIISFVDRNRYRVRVGRITWETWKQYWMIEKAHTRLTLSFDFSPGAVWRLPRPAWAGGGRGRGGARRRASSARTWAARRPAAAPGPARSAPRGPSPSWPPPPQPRHHSLHCPRRRSSLQQYHHSCIPTDRRHRKPGVPRP